MIPHIFITKEKTDITSYIDSISRDNKVSSVHTIEIYPEKNVITIDQIRNLRKELQIKQSVTRDIIIWDFDTTTHEAQNALLKVLEEKNLQAHFFLQVSNIEKILPTILSRCTIVNLIKDTHEAVRDDVEKAIDNVLNSNNSYADFSIPLFQPASRDDTILFFKEVLIVLHRRIKNGETRLISLAKKTMDLLYKLEANNLNHQLTMDMWIIHAKRS